MDKETKRIGVGILLVAGFVLLLFSIYVSLIDPSGWYAALALNVSFLAIGVILIALAALIWKRY